IEQLYIPGGKTRRLLEALCFTYAIVMAGGVFFLQASYSRIVVALSAFSLFILATTLRVLFRVFLEWARVSGRSEVKILIVGTGAYAGRVADALTDDQVLPGKIAGYVHLPGHAVEVKGPLFDVEDIPL